MARQFESLISNAKIEFTDQILTELLTKQTTEYEFLSKKNTKERKKRV